MQNKMLLSQLRVKLRSGSRFLLVPISGKVRTLNLTHARFNAASLPSARPPVLLLARHH
jgi:hypothetical protein